MFPEAFAEKWISSLSQEGDYILDPFAGRGTTAFQSLLMNRNAITCDINPVAYCITKAKTQAPALGNVLGRINRLESGYNPKSWILLAKELPEFFQAAFSQKTLLQLLYLRSHLQWRTRKTDSFIAALVLGALHGESHRSSSYLSNQMPRTISTKPNYSIKYWRKNNLFPPERETFSLLRNRTIYRYRSERPKANSHVYHIDMRKLPGSCKGIEKPSLCLTSPPYYDVTCFEEDQWLRIWFLGGNPFPTRGVISRDDRHTRSDMYWEFISDMWKTIGAIMRPKSSVVIRIGAKKLTPSQITSSLQKTSIASGRKVELVSAEASEIRNRQTDTFTKNTRGCAIEIDYHFDLK